MVLLHEGLGCVALWRDFPKRLAEATGWGVFVYSRLGYGESDPVELPRPLDYMTEEALENLAPVLDAFSFERGVLFGHSDGGTIAAAYAGLVQDPRLMGIIAMAPHFFSEEMQLAEIARAKEAFETTGLKAKMSKYHRDLEATFYGWNDSWLHPDFEVCDEQAVLGGITVPVLALQGREDQYGTLTQIDVIERLCAGPVRKEVIENCRHSPQFDQPDAVILAVTSFIDSLGG